MTGGPEDTDSPAPEDTDSPAPEDTDSAPPETVSTDTPEPVDPPTTLIPLEANPAPPVVAAVASAPEPPVAEPDGVAGPASHRAAKRRRWPWILLAVVVGVVVVVIAGGLWYLSTLIRGAAAIDQPGQPFPLTVLSADGGAITYTEGESKEDELPLMGVATIEGGYVQTSDPSTTGEGTVATTTRSIDKQVLAPPPAPDQRAVLDAWFYPRDPKVGLGVDFETITYDAPLGPTPAWYIPGTKDTWVIFTHGRAVTPREGLRMASTVTQLGYPMLLISYRDDAGAPVEDGLGNFGQTEEADLQAAVDYALANGAKKIVLTGASMGAAIDLAFLQHSPQAASVVGAFLDSPATDFGRMVRNGASDMGVPDVVTSAAMQVAAWRFGIDWAAVDHTAGAGAMTTPMVIVQGAEDGKVPPAVTQAFVDAAPDGLVQYEEFPGAGHVQAWNVDRTRYDGLLRDFLTKVAP